MKQDIASKQLNELSKKGKERLEKWLKKSGGYHDDFKTVDLPFDNKGTIRLPIWNIGEMIEFLKENQINNHWRRITFDERMCYALWEACKEVLNAK